MKRGREHNASLRKALIWTAVFLALYILGVLYFVLYVRK